MLNPRIKRHIKLLAEKFDHMVSYDRNDIFVLSDFNSICIGSTRKGLITLVYNAEDNLQVKIEVGEIQFYDPYINILKRTAPEKVEIRNNDIIQLQDFMEFERIARRTIPELKHELYTNQVDHKYLGGNRFEAEYYKGIITLIDDLPNGMLSNVIDVKIEEL